MLCNPTADVTMQVDGMVEEENSDDDDDDDLLDFEGEQERSVVQYADVLVGPTMLSAPLLGDGQVATVGGRGAPKLTAGSGSAEKITQETATGFGCSTGLNSHFLGSVKLQASSDVHVAGTERAGLGCSLAVSPGGTGDVSVKVAGGAANVQTCVVGQHSKGEMDSAAGVMAAAAIMEAQLMPQRSSPRLALHADMDSMKKAKKRAAWKNLDFSGGNFQGDILDPTMVSVA